ncbi:EamA family transporter [Thermomonas sp.]|jgi:undecaprenyl phosphate-alpha-L-ara4N flippase subunit ArnE|uniref:EamA family transporter n=1 Tax=Thermomonas sp. TaxID=1971895 RepID=UPI002599EDC3|nr:EamA family transporter [Thermomonas sp.]HOC12164.1 EamA family transporter [Thermomonas sp.]HOV96430.1 EamA family transporter [Thermomonas sp.]HQA02983.1 EamA family transporter [Thermomonas sp.]HQE08777.1 EamA family transporter [Thermomonas sp.]
MIKSEFLTPSNVALIVGTILLLSLGQVLFKAASAQIVVSQPASWVSLPLLAALVVYGLATGLWLVVLSRVPLSFAFAFYGLAFLLVPLLAALFLREPLRWQVLVGGIVILCGIAITSWGART